MFLKIYYGEKPIFLCDEIDDTILPFIHHDDSIFFDELNTHTINTLLYEMRQPAIHAIVFYNPQLIELTSKVFKKFKQIRAGGGLVLNEKEEVLLIFRRGKWDLPKGKLDKGETIEDCAVREVMEETGLECVTITKPLVTTWHIYQEGASLCLKQTDWFSMGVKGMPTLTPQLEEDITDLKWVPQNDLSSYQENTFPSVKEVLALL
jgi:8-oxo-dGTP pyrophosphatase MutT (NUDIX family)